MLEYLNQYQGPIDRLELVSIDPIKSLAYKSLRSLITAVSSYLASSMV